jgi:uncharacterized protein (TIGR02217 family)
MTFLETSRFPTTLRFGLTGGPEYSTDIVVLNSGWEQRNANWSESRGTWSAEYGPHSTADTQALIAFFHAVRGSAHGFRFKDPSDNSSLVANGVLGLTGEGAGVPTYQMYKRYTSGALSTYRKIRKPISSGLIAYDDYGALTWGSGAGQISVDTTTGIITFVAHSSSAASAITVGYPTVVRLASDLGLIYTKKLYLNGFSGDDAVRVNGLAHTILSITGGGPYDFHLDTGTVGPITVGSGVGYRYPQAGTPLTWAGNFDVPARFGSDKLDLTAIEGGYFTWGNISIEEIRT